MDYSEASKVGDAAEAVVADTLQRLQARYGFRVLHDVLLCKDTSSGPITAQLDHVVIDEMGILVIETKVRTRAQLRGTYAEANWTACYPSGTKAPMQNPLRQNEQHLHLLHQLLKDFDSGMSLDSVRGCVVFVDTDISHLELDSVTRHRVRNVDELPAWFDDRYAFATRTPLTVDEQVALAVHLISLDRSNQPDIVRAHAVYRSRGEQVPQFAAPKRPGTSKTATRGRTAEPQQPFVMTSAPLESRGTAKPLLMGAAVVAALLFALWLILGFLNHTTPTWVYVVGLVLLMVFGEEEKRTRGRRRGGPRSGSKSQPASFGQRLIALAAMLVVLGVLWLAMPWILRQISAWSSSIAVTPAPAPAPVGGAVNVPAALVVLRDTNPIVYENLVQPNSPKTAIEGATVSYEWEYLDKTTPASVQVRRLKITLDASGRLIGVTGS